MYNTLEVSYLGVYLGGGGRSIGGGRDKSAPTVRLVRFVCKQGGGDKISDIQARGAS